MYLKAIKNRWTKLLVYNFYVKEKVEYKKILLGKNSSFNSLPSDILKNQFGYF